MLSFPFPSDLVVYKRVAGANPAAGIEASDAVPAGKFWMLISYMIAMVQGITQTPQPILQIDDGTNNIVEFLGCSAAQAVSTTCTYVWSLGFAGGPTGQLGATPNLRAYGPHGKLLLPAESRLK